MGVISGGNVRLLPGTAPLPADWTFWADTIVGAEPLGPVQPVAFHYTSPLSDFGKGEVTVPVESSSLPQDRLLNLWSWRLWAFYDGQPVWCGVPTGIADEGAATTTLTLTEITGYLEWRQWDYPGTYRFSQVEHTEIARNLASPLADVGVPITTSPGPGFLRDREYAYLEGQSRAELLTNLSQVISGPQFRTVYTLSGGMPVATLAIGYPRVGVAGSGLGLIVPGNAAAYHAAWDADQLRTRTFAVGELPENAAEGATAPVVMVDRPRPDVPRLDRTDDWAGVILASTLTERANTAATQYAAPVLDLSGQTGISDPPLPGYGPGDDVTVRLVTPLLPGGIEVTGWLTEIAVDAAAATADWTVAITLPAPRPREGLSQRLDRIDTLVRAARRGNLAQL